MSGRQEALPHWDLTNVYPGLESEAFNTDRERLAGVLDDLDALIAREGVGRLTEVPSDASATAEVARELITRLNEALRRGRTLTVFVHSFVTTDSRDTLAARTLSELEKLQVRLRKQLVRFQAYVGSLEPHLDAICKQQPLAAEHRLVLEDCIDQSRYLMEEKLEDLASELQLTGGGAMWKLQGNVTSQLKAPVERDGKTEELPMTMVRNLAQDPDEGVRQRAYEAELKAWESVREPVAFALNCVKGAAVTLASWRGHDDVLHTALERNHIERETLDALLGAIRDAFPVFRRYLRSKAEKLGKEKLPWWDLFAPVGKVNPTYTWPQATDFIVEQFGTFSPELADYARAAFAGNWIDAEPRDGKRGGAFCMGVPGVEESRILANFDGSFDQMITLAHELGHGYHNFCQKGLPQLRRGSPMVLAETASIFCETLVFSAAMDAAPAEAQLAILENQLIGATQVTVDISSRFIFESQIVAGREKAELSADDFCAAMVEAQKETYGDALDPDHLHPYLWLLKPHYYMGDLHFYNFPYAFGLLFGLGVYAIYLKEGEAFIPRYKELLRATGAGKAADLAARFGIDIRSRTFWERSLAVIAGQVDRYCELEA
jgi:pepF/M3 family oligoendopeptidase